MKFMTKDRRVIHCVNRVPESVVWQDHNSVFFLCKDSHSSSFPSYFLCCAFRVVTLDIDGNSGRDCYSRRRCPVKSV